MLNIILHFLMYYLMCIIPLFQFMILFNIAIIIIIIYRLSKIRPDLIAWITLKSDKYGQPDLSTFKPD